MILPKSPSNFADNVVLSEWSSKLHSLLVEFSLHKFDHILQIMNSIDNTIQFTCEIEKNGVLPFLDTPTPTKTSQYLSIAKTSLFLYLHMLIFAIRLVKKWPHFTLLLIAP